MITNKADKNEYIDENTLSAILKIAAQKPITNLVHGYEPKYGPSLGSHVGFDYSNMRFKIFKRRNFAGYLFKVHQAHRDAEATYEMTATHELYRATEDTVQMIFERSNNLAPICHRIKELAK